MITPDPAFRPNPDRAIYLQGEINQDLVDRHTHDIIKLKHRNLEPITVYIDSIGGDPTLGERLLKLLLAGSQDSAERCNLITVVTSQAASAAADLLSSGDYAIAYPGASLLYHGTRLTNLRDRPLTREWTSLLSDYLRERNNVYAMRLAEKVVGRFMFRFITSRGRFDQIRADYKAPNLNDLGCFLLLLMDKLSEQGVRVLTRARERYERYDDLLEWLMKEEDKRTKRRKTALSAEEYERFRIKAVIDFEFDDNKNNDNWSFEADGIRTLTDDFFLLSQYTAAHRTGMFSSLSKRYGNFFMSPEEKAEIEKLSEAEREVKKADKTGPLFFPLFSFFMGLCYALQEDENQLTAIDAYWLGLIDEVFGDDSLPNFRLLTEYTPDKPAESPEAGNNEEEENNENIQPPITGTEGDAGTEARP